MKVEWIWKPACVKAQTCFSQLKNSFLLGSDHDYLSSGVETFCLPCLYVEPIRREGAEAKVDMTGNKNPTVHQTCDKTGGGVQGAG